MTDSQLTLDDFDFHLPPERIAQAPLANRSASRLLHVQPDVLVDGQFVDLPSLLREGDLLVINDTRVLHARLFGRKASGGQIEVLVERVMNEREALAQVRASKPPKPGSTLLLEDALELDVLGREGEFYHLRFPGPAVDLLEHYGRLPLPPYIERPAGREDEARYQTVYAGADKGSVAAPTAGLHFDEALLASLAVMGVRKAHVTLHVGAGTFQPVRVQQISEHKMHSERYVIPEATVAAITATRAAGGRVVAVGTTSLRALESATPQGHDCPQVSAGDTAIFITPGYRFRCVDALITNFHLPKSTLLMLVSAFVGVERIRSAYAHAIAKEYRFFSYGDAMLLERAP
jgi:S-adenosylmethionine:tRNA ribosyltransferase-isomerase